MYPQFAGGVAMGIDGTTLVTGYQYGYDQLNLPATAECFLLKVNDDLSLAWAKSWGLDD